jgi:dTDP-4-amino-4,6-dideoxygalactose transaminase
MPGPGLDVIGLEELKEVDEVLRTRQMSRYRFGDEASAPSKVYQFERELEALTGARHCLGMNSCTTALLAGMWASGIGPGDEVIVPAYTFVASIAAVAYTGATPVLAEIDGGLTLDPDDVRRRITPRTRAVLAVHMLGTPCNLSGLSAVCQEHGLQLFEDCAQAGGGSYQGRALGTHGVFGAFSLNVFKTFTAGDGGVLLTNDTDVYSRAFALHDHGARPLRLGVADANSYLGLNFRMHELTGAVALAQVRKLPMILERIRSSKAKLLEAIGTVPHVRERTLHDPSGECATVAAFTFDTEERAAAAASRLGTIPLSGSGKHNYANIPQLAAMPLPRGIQLERRPASTVAAGAFPQTDSILARTVALSVGVVDSYLGAGFGINIHSTDHDIDAAARTFRAAVSESPNEGR